MKRLFTVASLVLVCTSSSLFVDALIAIVPSGKWAAAPDVMPRARAGASAVALADGRVLITGGLTGDPASPGVLRTADLFGGSGTFTPASPMTTPRARHASVLLKDGRVLVTGGVTGGGSNTASAEIFEPSTNSWSSAGEMLEARSGHTMSLLKSGNVLIAGGASLEVYNPSTEQFSFAGVLNPARTGHAAAVLQTGRVVIAGGQSEASVLTNVDVYDEAVGLSPLGSLSTPRAGLSATTLLDGNVLFAGGSNSSGDLASAEIYRQQFGSIDPSSNSLSAPRSGHQALLLPNNNSVLIVGGTSAGVPQASAELYLPWSDSFRTTGSMAVARTGAVGAALLQDGLAMVAGGQNADGYQASAELYGFATVKTDRDDYAPGETVTITGSGWKPGELVALHLLESPQLDQHSLLPVTVDESGHFVSTEWAPDEHDLNIRFYLTATGSVWQTQAQNTFTDGVATSVSGAVVSSGPGNPPIAGATITCSRGCNNNPVATTTSNASGAYVFDHSTTKLSFAGNGPAALELTASKAGFGSQTIAVTISTNNSSITGANFTLTASSLATTTSVSASPNPSSYGQGVSFTATVSPASGATAPTGTVQFVIDGVNFGPPVPLTASGSNGVATSESTATLTVGGSPHSVTANYTATGNFVDSSGSLAGGQTVNKANATIVVTPYSVTYDGAAHTATGTATGVNGESLSGLNLSDTTHTNAGTYTGDAWTFTDVTGNYNNASGTVNDSIAKANATVTVNGYTGVYDAAAHGAAGSATGVGGVDLSSGLNLGATFTDVPGGTAHWTFTGGTNYADQSGDAAIVINKAKATVTVNGYTGVYDAAAHGAAGSATGVGGVNLSSGLTLGATFTDVPGGTAHWTFSGGTNYTDQSGDAAIVINKATATVTVNGYTGVYDATAHGATGSATGVGGVNLSSGLTLGATFTDVPGGTAHWTFTGGTNYTDSSGSVAVVINKANATIVVTPYSVTYDGVAHTASGTARGVLSESLSGLDLSGTTHTNAGSYTDTWTFSNANYSDASGRVDDSIAKANATVIVVPYNVTYDGVAHTASGTATGVLSESLSGLDLSGTTHTNAGTYTDSWTFTDVTGNYNKASNSISDSIAKANATINVTGYTGVYDGSVHGASGTATGANGANLNASLDLGATFKDVPGGTAHWTFNGGTNYNDNSGSVAIVINKANATIVVTPYSVTYNGAAHTATGTATGAGGENLNGLLVLGATTHTAAGSYPADPWSFPGDANHNSASGTVSNSIAKANAVIRVTPYSVTYDGAAHTASGTVTGVLGESLSGLNLSGTTHTNAGTYAADAWTFTDVTGNYNHAGGTVSDSIAKANAVINVTPYHVIFDGAAHTATGTATGVLGESLGGLNLTGTTHTDVGTWADAWSFTDKTGNYNDASGTVNDSIGAWKTSGFYQPVDMSTPTTMVWNLVKGGSTVPLKFNLFAGSTEKTSVTDIKGFYLSVMGCSAGLDDVVDATLLTTGGTTLRYSGTPGADGQFLQNWQTPKQSGQCYRVTMTARDGSTISAFFKLK